METALHKCRAAALDLLYPPSCLSCRAAVGQPHTLCSACWCSVRFIERPFCERLGTPFALDLGTPLLSPAAIADPPVYHRARAVARFEEGAIRELVHRLKYGDRTELAKPMGVWMARAGAELLREADVIVPIPLHRLRLMSRRFNQASALAQSIAVTSGVRQYAFLLTRTKSTPPQIHLSRTQRAENMQGAFEVPDMARARLLDRRVILVDDVLTSGATLNAAARTLLRGGAASVDALVFARVVTEG